MPNTWSSGLRTHIAGVNTTIALCWKLTRTDSQVFGFTNHPQDLTIGGTLYRANSGMMPTAIMSRSSMQVDNAEIKAFLRDDMISETELRAGLFSYAAVDIFCVNYKDLTQGTGFLGKGKIGAVGISSDGTFVAEFRSVEQALLQSACNRTSVTCRVKALGNAQCGVDVNGNDELGRAIRRNSTVSSATDNQTFIATGLIGAGADIFRYGKVEWLSAGDNSGLQQMVSSFNTATGAVNLFQPMPFTVNSGDTFTIEIGCDRRIETCIALFDNATRFRGEPFIPGPEGLNEVTSA